MAFHIIHHKKLTGLMVHVKAIDISCSRATRNKKNCFSFLALIAASSADSMNKQSIFDIFVSKSGFSYNCINGYANRTQTTFFHLYKNLFNMPSSISSFF